MKFKVTKLEVVENEIKALEPAQQELLKSEYEKAMSVKSVAYCHPELDSGSHHKSTNLPDCQYMQKRSISALLVNPGVETMYSPC